MVQINEKIESGKVHAKQAFDAASEAAKASGANIKEQARHAYEAGRDHMVAAARDLGDAATVRYGEFREQASRVAEDYCGRARDFQNDAENYVRENPWQSVGIAAGVGLVLGILLARR